MSASQTDQQLVAGAQRALAEVPCRQPAGRDARRRPAVVGNIDTNRTQMSALVGAEPGRHRRAAGGTGGQSASRAASAAARGPDRRCGRRKRSRAERSTEAERAGGGRARSQEQLPSLPTDAGQRLPAVGNATHVPERQLRARPCDGKMLARLGAVVFVAVAIDCDRDRDEPERGPRPSAWPSAPRCRDGGRPCWPRRRVRSFTNASAARRSSRSRRDPACLAEPAAENRNRFLGEPARALPSDCLDTPPAPRNDATSLR